MLRAFEEGAVPIGGQAVIEGVLMRSPRATAVAVRRPGGGIVIRVRPARSFAERFRSVPGLRGVGVLIETLWDGLEAIRFSAEQATPEEASGQATKAALAGTMVVSFAIGFLLFAVLPHGLTYLFGVLLGSGALASGTSVWFHLVDGVLKVLIFLGFIASASISSGIRRVFQYHGAEHQAVHAYENGLPLSPKALSRFPTAHPRCGTSFLVMVIVVSIFVFATVFPWMPEVFEDRVANQVFYIAIKAPLILPIAALSYEAIKFSSRVQNRWLRVVLLAPGLLFQKITTRTPDEGQQEVAIAALMAVLRPERYMIGEGERVVEFASFDDLMGREVSHGYS